MITDTSTRAWLPLGLALAGSALAQGADVAVEATLFTYVPAADGEGRFVSEKLGATDPSPAVNVDQAPGFASSGQVLFVSLKGAGPATVRIQAKQKSTLRAKVDRKVTLGQDGVLVPVWLGTLADAKASCSPLEVTVSVNGRVRSFTKAYACSE